MAPPVNVPMRALIQLGPKIQKWSRSARVFGLSIPLRWVHAGTGHEAGKFVARPHELSLKSYIKQTITVNQHEEKAVSLQEDRIRRSLSTEELAGRGVAVFGLRLDPEYWRFTPQARVEIRLFRTSDQELRRFRPGKLVSIVWDEDEVGCQESGRAFRHPGSDPQFPQWKIVYGIVSDVREDAVQIEIQSLNNYLINGLGPDQEGREMGVYLLSRSQLKIYNLERYALFSLMKHPELTSDMGVPIFSRLLTDRQTSSSSEEQTQTSHYFNPNLDEAKLRAVDDCARCRNLTIIHGPPGTGKTTTLAAAVLSALANGDKVLVTAPSHAACDAITLAILAHWPVDILGQPDRGILVRQAQDLRLTVKSLSKYIVEKFILSDPEYRNQVQALAELRHDQIVRMGAQARGSSQLELEMTKSLSQLYQSLERNVLEAARVVVTTSFSVLKSHLFSMVVGRDLNLVCIDEAGFARDQLALHCIAGAARLILAGDHLQLPPIYLSPYAQRVGFNKSFLERLVELCPESVTLLTTQYRSHRLISEWSSNYFYQGQVEAAPSVRDQLLIHLTGVKESKLTTMPMVFIDTKGRQYYEEDGGNLLRDDEDESIFNYNEAFVVEELVSQLLALNVRPHDIGVITPYWAQVTLLRSLIWADESQSGIEIRTVDGYQGREKEVIIMSFVRSNKQNELGFLRESRRTNVSITRARRACIAIGDSETLSHNHALKSLFTFCKDNEAVIPVSEVF